LSEAIPAVPLVALPVEIGEKDEEEETVGTNPPHEPTRVVAGRKQELEGMPCDEHELNLRRIVVQKSVISS